MCALPVCPPGTATPSLSHHLPDRTRQSLAANLAAMRGLQVPCCGCWRAETSVQMRPTLSHSRAPQGQTLSQLLESPFSSTPEFLKGTEGLRLAYLFELPGEASEGVAGTLLTELGVASAPLLSHCVPVTPLQCGRGPVTLHPEGTEGLAQGHTPSHLQRRT